MQGRFKFRFLRITLLWGISLGVTTFILFWIYGTPIVPARGDRAWSIYQILTITDVFAMFFLIFLVVNSTLYCYLFVRQLSNFHSRWPDSTTDDARRALGLVTSGPRSRLRELTDGEKKGVDDWIDLRLIAMRSACVNLIVWYPFIVIALMMLSRSSLFANFPLSPPIAITQLIGAALIFGCALALNGVAERQRDISQAHLRDEILQFQLSGRSDRAEQWRSVLHRVTALREGSFLPFLQQPVVRGLLLPLGSAGWTQFFEQGHQLFRL